MKSILLAFQFLTILPLKINNVTDKAISRSTAWFPVAGLFIGLLLAGANYFMTHCGLNELAVNVILVVLLVILTGGLHLDGLSDTADAFFSGRDRVEMLRIMRDPHIGVMGVLALISVLMLKIALLLSINPAAKGVSLVLICVLSRWSMALSLFAFPYARTDGKAKVMIDGINKNIFITATLVTLIIVFAAAKVSGAALLIITAVFAYTAGSFIKRKIGGVTGDTIGAVNELSEIVALLGIIILEKYL